MKIYHLSTSTRDEGNAGGVEKFGWYLQKAINCQVITPRGLRELVTSNRLNKDDIVIAEGDHALSTAKLCKTISVIHGSWMEFAIRNDKLKDFSHPASKQGSAWAQEDILCVAVSQASANYATKHHKTRVDKVILNGVDTNLFKPINVYNSKPVIIHCATDYNKGGQGRLGKITELLPEFEFRFLDAKIGEEQDKFAVGDMFIQCSFYEGNSYAALEAMSCDLPVIASCAGLFEDTKELDCVRVGEVIPWDSSPEMFARSIRYMWLNKKAYQPREWVKQYASLETFKEKWEELLNEETICELFKRRLQGIN